MCHVHTNEEMANILETLADLFSWKRRARFTEAAVILRSPTPQWRHSSRHPPVHPLVPNVTFEHGSQHPDYGPDLKESPAA